MRKQRLDKFFMFHFISGYSLSFRGFIVVVLVEVNIKHIVFNLPRFSSGFLIDSTRLGRC